MIHKSGKNEKKEQEKKGRKKGSRVLSFVTNCACNKLPSNIKLS